MAIVFGKINHLSRLTGLVVLLSFLFSPSIEPAPWVQEQTMAGFHDSERELIRRYFPTIERHAFAEKVPVPLVLAMIRQESAFNAYAVSHKGALGLMQLMPVTAYSLYQQKGGETDPAKLRAHLLTQPDLNIGLGIHALAQIQHSFRHVQAPAQRKKLALATYNSGFSKIKQAFYCKTTQCLIYKSNHYGEGYFARAMSRLPGETKKYIQRVQELELQYSLQIGGETI